jgi:hypothetical protein
MTMATHRPEISNSKKKRLYAEAGHKCANPGCPNRRTHIHHIREWAVYQTHDEQHMIAVCPTCHDAIHHGAILIGDDVLYRWKAIPRNTGIIRSHLYIEPDGQAKLLLGTVAVTAPSKALVFELSPFNRLKFAIKDEGIMLFDLTVSTLEGDEVLRVSENYIKHQSRPDIEFLQVPGNIKVIVPCAEEFIPKWAVEHMREQEKAFGDTGRITALGISVIKPGLARVEGVWAQKDKTVVITQERLSFIRPDLMGPISFAGAGESSVLHYVSSGVIDIPLFGFDKNSTIRVGRKS